MTAEPSRPVRVTPGVSELVSRLCLRHPDIGFALTAQVVRHHFPAVTDDEIRAALAHEQGKDNDSNEKEN